MSEGQPSVPAEAPTASATGLTLYDPVSRAEVLVRHVVSHACDNCGSPAVVSTLHLSDLKRTYLCATCVESR